MKKHILQENYERFFGKREFGDPLPTFEDVMEKHQVNKLKEGWWDNMSDAAKKSYIKKHGSAPNVAGDDEPKVPAPDSRSDTGKPRVSANPYDDNYGQEVDDEDDYDMGEVPGSRGTGPWTPEDDPDFEKGPSLTSAPGRVPDEEPSDEEKLDPQKIKDDYATAGENLTFSKGKLDDAKATGNEEEISRIQSIVDNDRKEFVASRKTYYTANQEKIEDDYDTAEENMNFSRGELDDAKETGDEEEISRIQSTLDDDRKEFRKRRRELGRMEKAVGAKSPRTGNELNQETLMIDGKQFRRISEGVEKQSKPKYAFSEFYQRFKRQE